MARVTIGRLVTLQQHRIDEIVRIGERMRERAPDTLNRTIIQTRIRTVEDRWGEIRRAHDEIVVRADADRHAYVTGRRFDAMNRIYEETIDWLLTAAANLPQEEAHNPRRRERDDDDDDDRPAKLPRLDLPTFSGNYEDWDSFADIFVTLVHEAPRIKDTTKLQYLKSCLKGTAADLVKDVPILGVNYASTWKALQDRFHNPRLTVNKLLDSLASLPHLKKESAVDLRAFVDETQRIVRALTNLRAPVAHWDMWLVHTLEVRIDPESRKIWESELIARDRQLSFNVVDVENPEISRFPKFVDLVTFLQRRAQSLSVIHSDKDDKKANSSNNPHSGSRKAHHVKAAQSAKGSKCSFCSGNHFISRCNKFSDKKTEPERQAIVRNLKLCFNCLGKHKLRECKSTYTCKHCHEKHHSLLHRGSKGVKSETDSSGVSQNVGTDPASLVRSNVAQIAGRPGLSVHACTASAAKNQCSILLATAQVTVVGPYGKRTRARALLYQGSEATFISESLVQLLGLHRDRVRTSITGVGGCEAGTVKHATNFLMQSLADSEFSLEVNAFVLPQLTSELPERNLIELDLGLFKDLTLADPEFTLSDRVDLMLGADVYGQSLRAGLKTIPTTLLVAQNTALGWIVSGPTQASPPRRAAACNRASIKALRCAVTDDLSEVLQRFWTVEEVPNAEHKLNPQDEACEKLYAETHTREINGKFKVRLPLTAEPPRVAAETRRMALGALKHQQQRFLRDQKLASAYRDFMKTYLELGHMEPVPRAELNNPRAWYLPHHAVVTGEGEKSKIRVVFDASRKTHEKHCLNEFLMSGPALQSDLLLVLLNWRRYRYAFTADIVKMFRQIFVAREDQDLQRIVWSSSITEPPVDYRLTTVTYGTTCAPHLAIRTLLQLARDEKERFPLGAACLESNTYVDDMFAGADELATAVRIRDELVGILRSAGIELDKWAANESRLLPARVQPNDKGAIKTIESDSSVKTLGVHWNPSSDKFSFTATKFDNNAKLTKRSIYSNIARLFDPLGWLAPVTVVAKIIMQDLWIEKCDWDTPLSDETSQRWQKYCQSLSALPSLSIDRWLGLSQNRSFELYGFFDASKRAYAAVVYLRINNGDGKFTVSLLAAKTKASPVKTISISKLELCGAALLVKLICHLRKLDFLKNAPITCHCDNETVLKWFEKHACTLPTFIANRVSYVQTELPTAIWKHVPTKENPADLATRGVTPSELKASPIWWHGPIPLASLSPTWPQPPTAVQALHVRTRVVEPDFLSRYPSLTRLLQITGWCLRPALQRVRSRAGQGSYPRKWLTAEEIDNARTALIKMAQAHAFPAELARLRNGHDLPKGNPLRKLKPTFDHDGTLRVGGRLGNANVPYHVAYPPILPRASVLSTLFIRYAHTKALHGGPTLTISFLLRYVWIVSMRASVKSAIRKCVKCQRHKPRLAHQLMGDLPAARVIPAAAFSSTGLDYAGPFQLRASKGRGQSSYKGWIALFVCLATKAIHLEAVGDLTSDTFILALRRFMNRKGECQRLYSDNSTTFRGADAELRRMFQEASSFYGDVAPKLAKEGISWTFIPPTTPHYGGIWEAGVKSTKNLLKKTIGDHKLTFEELSTVLSDIEVCLNSRPLTPFTSDPEDLQALTPAHFLSERPSVIIPNAETTDIPLNRLDRFQLLQRLRDQFWKRWVNEYVMQLQERRKWRSPTENFKIGQLVLIKDDRYPASHWPLGRVIELHPGKDDLVRVVTVKTATNTLRRHIACLAPIDLDQPEDKEDKPSEGLADYI